MLGKATILGTCYRGVRARDFRIEDKAEEGRKDKQVEEFALEIW